MTMPTAASSMHLHQIDREHAAAAGAERLQRRDDVAAAVEMALHGIGDADAADQQRRQADKREELREALDVALELRRGVAARADLPAGLRKLLRACVGDRLCAASSAHRCRQAHAVEPAHQAAGLQQAGRAQRRRADQQRAARSRCRRRACPARSSAPRATSNVASPIVNRVAGLQVERAISVGSSDGAVDAVAFGAARRRATSAGSSSTVAEQRIGGIDRLHLDQALRGRPAARAIARMVAAVETVPCASQEVAFLRRWPRAGSAMNEMSPPRMTRPCAPARRRGSRRASRRRRSPSRRARCRR